MTGAGPERELAQRGFCPDRAAWDAQIPDQLQQAVESGIRNTGLRKRGAHRGHMALRSARKR
jgi:hypothetical protein